jgi:thiol-disulfide isomerase/thioredoxin
MHRDRQPVSVGLRLILTVAALVVIAVWIGSVSASAGQPSSAGVDLAGRTVDPLRAEAGKPVVLIFIRTDCPISNRYAPSIQRLSTEYVGKAAFWLVYPDKGESSSAIEQHLHTYGYKLPALHDPQHSLVKLGQVQVTPEAAVFDAGGQLVYHGRIDNWYKEFGRARPAPTTHELDDAIQAVLKGSKPAVTTADAVGCYISDLE